MEIQAGSAILTRSFTRPRVTRPHSSNPDCAMNPTDTVSTQQRNAPSTSAPGSAGGNDPSGSGFRATAEKARQAAGKVATQAKDKAAQVADEQKGTAAAKLGGYSSRLRAVAHAA